MLSFKTGVAVKVRHGAESQQTLTISNPPKTVESSTMQRRINPREANRMMQRMGMQVNQVDDVTRVIIESASKSTVIDAPEVAIVTVQRKTVSQVAEGTAREHA